MPSQTPSSGTATGAALGPTVTGIVVLEPPPVMVTTPTASIVGVVASTPTVVGASGLTLAKTHSVGLTRTLPSGQRSVMSPVAMARSGPVEVPVASMVMTPRGWPGIRRKGVWSTRSWAPGEVSTEPIARSVPTQRPNLSQLAPPVQSLSARQSYSQMPLPQ